MAGLGSAAEHARLIDPIRDALPPDFELVTPIPYTGLQRMFDESAPWGILAYEKSLYLDELTDDVIAVVTEQFPRKQSPLSSIPLFDLGGRVSGAYGSVSDDDTAFGGSRSARYLLNITAAASSPEVYGAERAWVLALWQALTPFSSNAGGYVNFMNEYEADRVRAAYGTAKYARLAEIKDQVRS